MKCVKTSIVCIGAKITREWGGASVKTMTILFSWRPDGSYECRNASTGCTRAARLAGTYAAIIATMIIAAAAAIGTVNRPSRLTMKVTPSL